jgi:hypothetical protein
LLLSSKKVCLPKTSPFITGGDIMLHMLFMAASFLITSQVFAQDASCGSQAMMTIAKADGSKSGLFISPTQISNSPAWSPETSEPPLSFSKAVQLATEWAKKEHKRFDGVQVRGINVTPYVCPTPKDRWYYTVHFAPIIDSIPLLAPGYFVAVLMDGTLVGPTPVK